MVRVLACLVLVVCCSSAWAFELPERTRAASSLFESDPFLHAQDADDEEDEKNGPRVIDGWFGRGFGIAIVVPISIHEFGIGAGIELSMPVNEHISVVGAATAHRSLLFEGGYYDLGVRVYHDDENKETVSFFADVGFRLGHGRVYEDEFSKSEIVTSGLGPGGFMNLGVEFGPPEIRFQVNVTGGGFVIHDDPNFTLLVGVRVGLRVYIGA